MGELGSISFTARNSRVRFFQILPVYFDLVLCILDRLFNYSGKIQGMGEICKYQKMILLMQGNPGVMA
jgi:hypothetical protein